MTYFWPALDSPLGSSGFIDTQEHEHFISTKFHKYPSSGSEVKADHVFHIYMY